MKKLLCVMLVVGLGIVCNNITYAQGIGVEGGVNLANINGDDFDDTKVRAGILVGVYYQMLLSSTNLYLQPEILYSQKGWKFDGEGGDATYKLDYIVGSVLLAYYMGATGPVNPFLKAGPYLGINTTAKADFDGDEQDLDDVNETDVGVLLRAGVRVNKLEIGARLAQGFTEIVDGSDAKNFLFGFFIGFNL